MTNEAPVTKPNRGRLLCPLLALPGQRWGGPTICSRRALGPGFLASRSHLVPGSCGAGGDGKSSGSHGRNTQDPGPGPVSEGGFYRRVGGRRETCPAQSPSWVLISMISAQPWSSLSSHAFARLKKELRGRIWFLRPCPVRRPRAAQASPRGPGFPLPYVPRADPGKARPPGEGNVWEFRDHRTVVLTSFVRGETDQKEGLRTLLLNPFKPVLALDSSTLHTFFLPPNLPILGLCLG